EASVSRSSSAGGLSSDLERRSVAALPSCLSVHVTERLAGKVAIVTGGASGIGHASAMLMAAEGAAVVIGDIDAAGGAAVAQEIGSRARFVEADVSRRDDARRLAESAVEAFGALHVLHDTAYWAPTGGTVLE